jgi:hypothetical protein
LTRKATGSKRDREKEIHTKQEREGHTEGRGVKRVIESETERGRDRKKAREKEKSFLVFFPKRKVKRRKPDLGLQLFYLFNFTLSLDSK